MVKEDFFICKWGNAVAHSDPWSSGAGCQVWGHVMALGPGVCDVSLARSTGIHSIDKYVIFGKHCRRSTVASRAFGVLSSTFSSSGQAAMVAGASVIYTLGCRDQLQVSMVWQGWMQTQMRAKEGRKGQDQLWAHWQLLWLWMSACSPIAMQYLLGMHMVVEAGDRSQSGGMQIHS